MEKRVNSVCREVFRGIYESKWLNIEYENQNGNVTKYWIAIKEIFLSDNPVFVVDGLHVGYGTIKELRIFLKSIRTCNVIDGTFYDTNIVLKEDIEINPEKYVNLFGNVANLKILNYLCDCHMLDSQPFSIENYALLKCFDKDKLISSVYNLTDEQFRDVVKSFHFEKAVNGEGYTVSQLAMNILSVQTKKGLYVLAYRKLNFDVSKHCFRPEDGITICSEFRLSGEVQSIRQFLSEDELSLLDDFTENLNEIEDRILINSNRTCLIDDMPYVMAIGRNIIIDLNHEYSAIYRMYEEGKLSTPLKAFFGDLLREPSRRSEYPITLLDNRIDLDQLLAIQHAVKYPVTYVQGPPGTGKTNTIINAIITQVFNGRTVLFSSYNNHPLDSVSKRLMSLTFQDKSIPFPMLRIGNAEKNAETMEYIRYLYNLAEKSPDDRTEEYYKAIREKTGNLSKLMKEYDEILELNERKEAIEKMLETINGNMNFQLDLQAGQLQRINDRLKEIGSITIDQALRMLADFEDVRAYLYYRSYRLIRQLRTRRFETLIEIVNMESVAERNTQFNRYVGSPENMKMLLKVFPVVVSTCLSSYHIGEPQIYFDITIMDEASQCNNAVSLIPIIRSSNLMLVGDPQQLRPVILLDPNENKVLKDKYHVDNEYDYIENSIYKTFLSVDSVSREVLLSHHYRCDRKIIEFCNRKYYNKKLVVETKQNSDQSLVLVNVQNDESNLKNSAPGEIDEMIDFIIRHNNRSIGIITPFVNQRKMIEERLQKTGIESVSCGTVHAFQGDEKDIILFSTALSSKTNEKTYDWLKNNKELINVAVSRARSRLVVFSSVKNLLRLHSLKPNERDDLYELINYVRTNGESKISEITANSRALGIKPYSTQTEDAFLTNLNHCLDNIFTSDRKCTVKREVPIAQVFSENTSFNSLFYTGRFDFVVYERNFAGQDIPIMAIELDGREHLEDEVVKSRDKKKQEICREHGFNMIRVDNSYARRYNYMKEVLIDYFTKR